MTSRRAVRRANRRGRPNRLCTRVVELAVLALPAGDLRKRYERELVAEMYGLSTGRQAGHAISTLACAWALRRAVLGSSTGGGIAVGRRRKPMRCLFNLSHHYERHTTDDGTRYLTCSRCGEDYYSGIQSVWAVGLD